MVSSISSNAGNGDGNTSIPISTNNEQIVKRKKQISPARHWCLTWNNYPDNWLETFRKFQSSKIQKYVLGREIGKEGTPHIQGYICFVKKCRPKEVITTNEIHWAKTRNIRDSIIYCAKDGDYEIFGLPRIQKLDILPVDKFYPWQSRVLDIINEKICNRTIFWIWESVGNVGKSALVKHICHHKEAVICSGKATDMKYMIAKFIEKKHYTPEIVIFDVPRSNLQYISFQGIEEIKNGCFASTKYDCEMVLMNSPHIFIFANEAPWEHMGYGNGNNPKMSLDRWMVYKIDDNQLVPDEYRKKNKIDSKETLDVFNY